jgi:hypothetical protein
MKRCTSQEKRTLVFFFSDNGAPFGDGHGGSGPNGGVNTPLRDGKHSVYEGGVRVPFVVSWPGHLPAREQAGSDLENRIRERKTDRGPDGCALVFHTSAGERSRRVQTQEARKAAPPAPRDRRISVAQPISRFLKTFCSTFAFIPA